MATFLIVANTEDMPYAQRVSPLLQGNKAPIVTGNIEYATKVEEAAKKIKAQGIITTNLSYLKALLPPGAASTAKIHNYAGSILASGKAGLDVLVLNPFRQTYSVPYGEWLMQRQISKLTEPHKWRKTSAFSWKQVQQPSEFKELLAALDDAVIVGVDTETLPPNTIEMVGYTALFDDGTSKSFVIYMDSMMKVDWMRRANVHPCYKVMQNGAYDAAHFFAWSAPIVNYIADTATAMHAWQAELPKDLGFLTQLFVRDSMYWKDLGKSTDKQVRMEYCALDTWGTAEAFLSWLAEAPKWARSNFISKMRLSPSLHACEMRGIKRDEAALKVAAEELKNKLATLEEIKLAAMTGVPGFNPRSSQQVKLLMQALGHGQRGNRGLPDSSDEASLEEAAAKHPLSERVFRAVLDSRGLSKLLSTYLTTGAKAKEYKGRILYSINGSGTDTGRAASKSHHFWCGLQIQNIPRESGEGTAVKRTLIADDGYVMFEVDKEQAEARGVAYCSGDDALLEAVDGEYDFHSLNASAFFGIPYHKIRQDPTPEYIDSETGELVPAAPGKTLDSELRDLAKRTNHGANYNMGAAVMLATMGSKKVREAQRLLGLPPRWPLIKVTEYLLSQYEVTYPTVKTRYYRSIISEVVNTGLLVGPTGWVRSCFGDPSRQKPALNAYVAHKTQSLNAMDLDQGFLNVFNWQSRENNWYDIQVFAQIHDSILGQVRENKLHLVYELAKQMHNPIKITCARGIERTLDVPLDINIAGKRWGGN